MKNKLAGIVIGILIIGLALSSGCTGDGGGSTTGNNPREILLSSFEKIENHPVVSLDIVQDININQEDYVPDNLKIQRNYNKVKITMEGYGTRTVKVGDEYVILDFTIDPRILLNVEQKKEYQNLLDNGAISFENLGVKTIADRSCDDIKLIIDLDKATDKEYLMRSTAITLVDLERYERELCLDKETGYPLLTIVDAEGIVTNEASEDWVGKDYKFYTKYTVLKLTE